MVSLAVHGYPEMDHRPSADEAFSFCAQVARTHYENFTVGSYLLPRKVRRHFFSVYAFSRFVDDLGDEASGDRLALLDEWEHELERCYDGVPEHPVFVALQETIQTFRIPIEPFARLVEANRIDQRRRRHQDYRELVEYCEQSANPVGHLVLYLFGYDDAVRRRYADQICTALQLANFWQDVRHDAARDRIYLPLEDLERFEIREQEILEGQFSDRFRSLMAFELARTRALFGTGKSLLPMVHRRLRIDLRLFVGGGTAILNAIERQDFNVLAHRPALTRFDKARIMLSAVR